MYKHLFRTVLGVVGILLMLSQGTVNAQEINKDIIIEATATEADQSLTINKYFANAYSVSRCDGCETSTLSSDTGHTYEEPGTYTITLSLMEGTTRWTFQNVNKPLVPKSGTTMTGVKIVSMPSLADGFGESASVPGNNFFSQFNYGGALESLPEGSFDTSKITKAGGSFFAGFNQNLGKLISLPTGSFDTSKITTAGSFFFFAFNNYGKLTSLPEGSFDISNITSAGSYFFYHFNFGGSLRSLPESFKLTSAAYDKTYAYDQSFINTSYTINRKVSDLVSGVTAPLDDRNTFSDNQPGRCGVHENWLNSIANACSITYDTNGGSSITNATKKYKANTTGVAVGNGIIAPTRTGYSFKGWQDASGNSIGEVVFPDMDGQTLYARWEECGSGYMVNSIGTSCVLKEYTITYNLGGGYLEDESGNKYEGNQEVTYTYDLTGNKYMADLVWTSVKRENSTFLGWYTSGGEFFDFGTILPENNTVYARYECNFGYIENGSGTNCEKIKTNFDANGGKFSDGTNKISILAIGKTIVPEESKMSHTINLTDEGEYKWWQSGETVCSSCAPNNGNNGSGVLEIHGYSTGYIQIDGAESLNVSIKYGGSSYGNTCAGPIGIWTGNHTDYEPRNPNHSGSAIRYLSKFPAYGTFGTDDFVVQGDSISIVQSSGCPNYGWYITVRKEGVYEVVYESGAFDDIPQPTRDGHNFKGWYLSDETKFNTGNVSTGEVTYVYAKWECAQGYVNKQGQCVKEETKPSGGSSGGGGGGGGGGGSSSSCKNLPANAVANNSSTPSSNTNYYYSTNTSKVCTFQCKSGYTRNAEKETCDKASDTQTTSGTNVKEPEGTGNNTKVETGNNTEIQTGSKIDSQPAEQASEQTPQDDNSDTQDSSTSSQNDTKTYSTEFQEAYEFAHENGITTKNTIQSADMNGKLTRIAMAKMLSQYAINVLGKTPDTTQNNKFNDVTDKLDSDYDDGVTLAYQLGIMGQNMPGNKFRPNDEVSRAEFATALSRMLYNTSDGQYKSTDKYYTNHMSKLVKEGIITKADPKMKELRGYVMIMLMRSAK